MTDQLNSTEVVQPSTVQPSTMQSAVHVVEQLQVRVPVWIATLGMLILMAITFWSALGLRTTALIEDWSFYTTFDQVGISPSTLFIASQPDRPFLTLVYALGYKLTPDSFIGLQLLGLIFFIGTGMALYAIIRQLWPENPVIAVTSALLIVIFPADTGWFNTRYYSYTLALLAFLIAVALLLMYWRRPRWWLIPGIWLTLLLCLGTYETAYPLVALTPVLLIWLNRRFSRRVARMSGLVWFPIPIAMLIYTIYALSTQSTYQGALLNTDSGGLGTRLLGYIYYDLRAYFRMFVQSWTDILHNFGLHADSYFTAASVLAGIVVLLSLILVWRIAIQNPIPAVEADPLPARSGWRNALARRRTSLILLAIGLATIGLGFLTYVPIPDHRVFTDRVYMFSSIGGAISVSVLIYAVASLAGRWRTGVFTWVFAILFAGLFGIASLGATGLAVGLHYDSGQEQLALAQFAQQVPYLPDGTVVIVFDDTRTLTSNQWRFGLTWYSFNLEAAVKFLYHQPNIGLRMCYPDRGVWGQNREQCSLDAKGVRLGFNGQTQTVPYKEVIAFNYVPDQGYSLLSTLPYAWQTLQNASGLATYNPFALIDRSLPLPARVYTMLENWPYVPFMPHTLIPQRAITINFEDANVSHAGETFQYPLLSDGWSASWNMATTASIHVLLAQGVDYRVSFHAIGAMSADILNSVTFSVNGQSLHVGVDDASIDRGETFGAIIPQQVISLNPTDTLIEFHTSKVVSPASLGLSADLRTLGANIDWLHIDPLPPTPASP